MFKRFQVLDLFCNEENNNVEWIDVKDEMPKITASIFKVRLSNGNEVLAYYCQDKCMPMMTYFKGEPTYWWDKQTKEPLYNVTHWGKRK
jgi:hypothetical protein